MTTAPACVTRPGESRRRTGANACSNAAFGGVDDAVDVACHGSSEDQSVVAAIRGEARGTVSSASAEPPKKERKKENGQPKGGMGGRHAATTQGFKERGVVR